jgi:threonine/homoserine/homoserine lactone efflux protein
MNFSSPAAIFVSSFIIALSGAMMPGPLLALTVRDTTRMGFRAAPLLVLGHGILEALLVALILLGLADWVRGEAATTAVALAGSLVLLWMAAGMAREARHLRFAAVEVPKDAEKGKKTPGRLHPIWSGVAASVSNPYWVIWWATIGLGYLVLSGEQGTMGVALFFTGHILADAAWYLFVGFAISAGRGRLTDRAYRAIAGACSLCLVFFAVSFGYWGFVKLIRMP